MRWKAWIATKLGVQAHVNWMEKQAWFRMGMAYVLKKPIHTSFEDYPRFLESWQPEPVRESTPLPDYMDIRVPSKMMEPPRDPRPLGARERAEWHKDVRAVQHTRPEIPGVWPWKARQGKPGQP